MVNFNGILQETTSSPLENNRGFLFGDAVFETMKVLDGKILFSEDHYFRLMASMRVLRMEIPMSFTLEYLEEQVLALLAVIETSPSYRVRITCFRKSGGFYLPEQRDIQFLITATPLPVPVYQNHNSDYEVEIFKDFYVSKHLLSTLKTTNKLVHITASIFAEENGYDNCLLLNDDKNVIEGTQGNLFMVIGSTIVTPPLSNGCLNGIMRKQLIRILQKNTEFTFEERAVSPFELQKADELFLTNVIQGIRSVTKYRKKRYTTQVADKLIVQLNTQIRLG